MADDCLAAVPEPPEGQELHDLLQHWPLPSRAPNATPRAASVSWSAVGVRTVVDAGNGDEVAGVVEAVQDPVGAAAGTALPREVIAQWFADPARVLRQWAVDELQHCGYHSGWDSIQISDRRGGQTGSPAHRAVPTPYRRRTAASSIS